MDDVIKILEILAGFLGPIAVAWFTWYMNKSQKENAKIKEYEKKEQEEKEQKLNDRFNDLMTKIDHNSENIVSIASTIGTMKNVDEKFEHEMRLIIKQHQLSGRYTHELAQLVITLAAGMRDQHLYGNITRAIENYQDFEHQTLSSMLSEYDN